MNADILHKGGKTDKRLLFETRLDWLQDSKGILTANDVGATLYVATPPALGGKGNDWSAEHLLLGALNSCFMATYLAFAKKSGLTISHFNCNAIGQVELVDGSYKFTTVNLYPEIFIADEAMREKANLALEKTHKYSLVAHSVNAQVFFHSRVLLDAHPK